MKKLHVEHTKPDPKIRIFLDGLIKARKAREHIQCGEVLWQAFVYVEQLEDHIRLSETGRPEQSPEAILGKGS